MITIFVKNSKFGYTGRYGRFPSVEAALKYAKTLPAEVIRIENLVTHRVEALIRGRV